MCEMKTLRWILALLVGIGGCVSTLYTWVLTIGPTFVDRSVPYELKLHGAILWACALGLVMFLIAVITELLVPDE